MDGRFVFASPYDLEVIGKLMELGVPDPIPLVQSARNWGAVEIYDREEDAPILRPLR